MVVAGQELSIVGLAALGVVVGFVAGLFGIGGGFVLTPLLTVFGVPLPVAIGSGLCQMVGTAVVALLSHRELRQGEVRFDLLMLGGSFVGVAAGARAVGALERAGQVSVLGRDVPLVALVIYPTYVVFLLATAASLLRRRRGGVEALAYVRRGPLARIRLPPYVDLPAVPLRRVSCLVVAYLGLGLGLLSGLLGIGGGVALMPALLYGFGFPIRQAAGTGIVVLFATAVTGTVAHALEGHVHLGMSLVLLVGASVSAQLGALATSRLSPAALRRGLAVLVLVTVAAVVWALANRFR